MARPTRKPPRVPRIRPSIWSVLAEPKAHPERNRRLGDNLFIGFLVMWIVLGGWAVIVHLMRVR